MMAPREAPDTDAIGLAIALAALATHALAALAPGVPRGLDQAARVIAFVLLPGWAATRLAFARRELGGFETAGLVVGLGAVLAFLTGPAARAVHVNAETVAVGLACFSLLALTPRRESVIQSAPGAASAKARSDAPASTATESPAAQARTRS